VIDRIIVPLVIFAYGFLFLHLGIVAFFIKYRRRIHDILLALTLDFSVMCLVGSYTVYNGLSSKTLNFVVFISLVAIAPIGLDLFMEFFSVRNAWIRTFKIVTAATVAVIGVAMALFYADVPPNLIYSFGYAWLILVLSGFLVIESWNLLPLWTMPPTLKGFYALICFDIFCISGIFLVQITGYISLSSFFWFLVINSLILKIIHIIKHPGTFEAIEDQISVRREVRSRIANLDESELSGRLQSLMSDDRVFLDPELRLAGLAAKLKITPHQLSEFINKKHAMTFNAFINQYRIDFACILLKTNLEYSILDIVYESGFNSKSAFNTAFKTITGMTPTGYYRQECGTIKKG
jgi:AraC-like DNA-binding protein